MEKLSFYRKRIETAIGELATIRNSGPLCLRVGTGFLEVYKVADNEVIMSATTPDRLFSYLTYAVMIENGKIEIVEDEEEVEINLLDEAFQGIEFEPVNDED